MERAAPTAGKNFALHELTHLQHVSHVNVMLSSSFPKGKGPTGQTLRWGPGLDRTVTVRLWTAAPPWQQALCPNSTWTPPTPAASELSADSDGSPICPNLPASGDAEAILPAQCSGGGACCGVRAGPRRKCCQEQTQGSRRSTTGAGQGLMRARPVGSGGASAPGSVDSRETRPQAVFTLQLVTAT